MKATRTIAWTALASLLVIGPLTMTRAHEPASWPGYSSFPLLSSGVSTEVGNFLSVDLRVTGLSASALGEAIQTSTVSNGGFVIKRVAGVPDYIIVATPGALESVLIQIDVKERPKLVAHLYRCNDFGGLIITCPKADDRSITTVVITGAFEDGMDAQGAYDAGAAAALLMAGGTQF